MTLILNLQNLMLLMTKLTQNMIKAMKMIWALNMKQKSSNQTFVIIHMDIFL